MESEEGNKLIAKFMDFDWKNCSKFIIEEDKSYSQIIGDREIQVPLDVSDLKYHESWDELMPVVEKIEKEFCTGSNGIEVIIHSSSCIINKWNGDLGKYSSFIHTTGSKIEAVYKAVVEFIKWYNKNN